MRRPRRHPALEAAVFAAALLLSAFLARELWRRRPSAPPSPETAATRPAALHPTRPALPSSVLPSRTEQAVTGMAPLKLSRVQRRKPKPAAVPVPK